jgi:hypothetical protein
MSTASSRRSPRWWAGADGSPSIPGSHPRGHGSAELRRIAPPDVRRWRISRCSIRDAEGCRAGAAGPRSLRFRRTRRSRRDWVEPRLRFVRRIARGADKADSARQGRLRQPAATPPSPFRASAPRVRPRQRRRERHARVVRNERGDSFFHGPHPTRLVRRSRNLRKAAHALPSRKNTVWLQTPRDRKAPPP